MFFDKYLYARDINNLDRASLIQNEHFQLLYKLTPIMMVANVLAAPILIASMWGQISHQTLLIWLGTLFFACFLTVLFYWYLKPFFKTVKTTPNNALIYYLLPFIFGAIWGATGYLFFTPDSTSHTLYLSITLFAFTSGGIGALSAIWGSYAIFAIPMLLPFALLQLFHGNKENYLIGAIFLSFIFILLLISKATSNFIHKSIQTRYENTELLKDLKIQTEQANKANKDKSRFLAAASHDLRQPIHSLSLLKTAIAPEIKTTRGKKILSQIGAANEAMLNLLNSLLDISKLDAEIIKPQIQAVNVDDLIANLFSEFLPIAKENNLELRHRPCDLMIKSDPVLLATILRNLLQNAIRYTPEGKVLVTCRKYRDKVLLQVWDTGNGIADEYQELIFTEFQQLQNPERDQNKGLGLGLAICRRLSILLNIPLSLKSVISKGSVFSLELELMSSSEIEEYKKAQQNKLQSLDTSENNFHEATILVIDDNEAILKAMSSLLESWDCIVITSNSVKSTKEIAKNHIGRIDAIIADFRLRKNTTGVDAIQAFNEIASYHPSAMLITGETAPEKIQEVSSHGIPVLHKPIKGPHLKIALGRLLRLSV